MNPQEKKFRAWDGHKMYYATLDALIVSMGSQGAGDWTLVEQVGEELTGFAGQLPAQHDCTMVYMEYTGMQDKHGKDIYEGDILLIGVDEERRFYPNVFVRWMTFRWQFTSSSEFAGWEFTERYVDNGLLEVIGNIYETPELLKPTAPPESET